MKRGGWRHDLKAAVVAGLGALLLTANAADVRERTRPVDLVGAGVTRSQEADITLTPTETAFRPIQTWVRSAGTIDLPTRTVTAIVSIGDAQKIRVGQRVRGFAVHARTRMHQGRVTGLTHQADGARVAATLSGDVEPNGAARYLLEIVTEQGPHLSIPNVAIIDDGAERVVYLQQRSGEYVRRVIRTALEGELYTQVTEGLAEGDLVVSIGSFFVDAEQKLSAAGAAAMFGICSTTPGMAYASLATTGLSRKSRSLGSQRQISELLDRPEPRKAAVPAVPPAPIR